MKKTVVVFNENGTVDYAFNISENSINDFFAQSRCQDESFNDNDVDAGYYELVNKYLNKTETANSIKLRNVSYDEVYELFENMEDNPKIDLGNGVYVKITDEGEIWDLGIETTDGNYRHTIGDFGDDVVCLLAGDEDYIDHLTYTLNEYINSVNEEKEA